VNGRQHYIRAEELLDTRLYDRTHHVIEEAQVHATLALAAATLAAGEENLRWWRGDDPELFSEPTSLGEES
jgi:hypothetical protein